MNISNRPQMTPMSQVQAPRQAPPPVQTEKPTDQNKLEAPPKPSAGDSVIQTQEDKTELVEQLDSEPLDASVPEPEGESTGLESEPMEALDAEAEALGVEVEEPEGDAEIEEEMELEDVEDGGEVEEEDGEGDAEDEEGGNEPDEERRKKQDEDEEDEDEQDPAP